MCIVYSVLKDILNSSFLSQWSPHTFVIRDHKLRCQVCLQNALKTVYNVIFQRRGFSIVISYKILPLDTKFNFVCCFIYYFKNEGLEENRFFFFLIASHLV